MAGTSDPLEDMLFSEVDEKAVSDLVGSLESQLVGQGGPGAPHTDSRSAAAASTANHHLGRALAAPVGSVPEPQQQGARKAGLSQEPLSNDRCSGKATVPPALSSGAPFGEPPSSTCGSGAKTSGALHSHVPSGPGSLAAQTTRSSVLCPEGSAAVASDTDGSQNHISTAGTHAVNGRDGAAAALPLAGTPANSAAPAASSGLQAGSGAAPLVNSGGSAMGSAVGTVNSSVMQPAVASSATLSAAQAQPDFPASQPTVSLDGPSPSLQRLPGHIMVSVSHNGTGGAAVPGDSAAPAVNHNNKSAEVGSAPAAEPPLPATQSTVIMPSQAGAGTPLPSPVTCAAPTASAAPAQLQSTGAPVSSSSLPLAPPVKATASVSATSQPPASTVVSALRPPGVPAPSATQPQQIRPTTAAAAQRIVAPQLIVRPPQQQTTIQLPPGFTIPPGETHTQMQLSAAERENHACAK